MLLEAFFYREALDVFRLELRGFDRAIPFDFPEAIPTDKLLVIAC